MILVEIESVNVYEFTLVKDVTPPPQVLVPIITGSVHRRPLKIQLFGLGCRFKRLGFRSHPTFDHFAVRTDDGGKSDRGILSEHVLDVWHPNSDSQFSGIKNCHRACGLHYFREIIHEKSVDF